MTSTLFVGFDFFSSTGAATGVSVEALPGVICTMAGACATSSFLSLLNRNPVVDIVLCSEKG